MQDKHYATLLYAVRDAIQYIDRQEYDRARCTLMAVLSLCKKDMELLRPFFEEQKPT